MTVKPLTEHHLEFLSLKGSCSGASESTLVRMSHCLKLRVTAHFITVYKKHVLVVRKRNVKTYVLGAHSETFLLRTQNICLFDNKENIILIIFGCFILCLPLYSSNY